MDPIKITKIKPLEFQIIRKCVFSSHIVCMQKKESHHRA